MAARIVSGWPEPYAGPLESLLEQEAKHAAALELGVRTGRVGTLTLLAQLADAVIVDEQARSRP